MTTLITGGTGFIGRILCEHLLARRHDIIVYSRQRPDTVKRLCGHSVNAVNSLEDIPSNTQIETIINLAGEPIADARWSNTRKTVLCNSRIETTKALVQLIHKLETKPEVFISGSAVGFYGDQSDKQVNETTPANDEFTHQLCAKWEACALEASSDTRVCLLRTGLVLGPTGGFLSKMWLPFKLGLGGILGNGKQFMPWIHIDDLISIIQYLIDSQDLEGAFNASAPTPATNREFTKTLGKIISRPTLLKTPAFILKILLGEMSRLLLTGQQALPQKLLDAGFEFSFTSLEHALIDVTRNKGYFY